MRERLTPGEIDIVTTPRSMIKAAFNKEEMRKGFTSLPSQWASSVVEAAMLVQLTYKRMYSRLDHTGRYLKLSLSIFSVGFGIVQIPVNIHTCYISPLAFNFITQNKCVSQSELFSPCDVSLIHVHIPSSKTLSDIRLTFAGKATIPQQSPFGELCT